MVDEPTLSQWLEQARAFADERKFLHALQLYHKITAAAPSLDVAWVELAHVQFELKQYNAAEKSLLKAVAASDQPQEILFLVGNLYLKIGQHSKALSYYKKLLGHQRALSTDLRAHLNFNTALAYYGRGNPKLAEIHFRATRKIDPRFPRINESLGELLVRRGAYVEAIQCLKQAVTLESYSWIGHFLLGTAYAKVYDHRNAHEQFVTAIDMNPKEPRAWQMCGEVLLSLQRLDEAERYLHKALELNPLLTDAAVDLGYLFLQRGDYQRARECFEHALQLDPGNSKALKGSKELKLAQHSTS